jgi:hypothetical protein
MESYIVYSNDRGDYDMCADKLRRDVPSLDFVVEHDLTRKEALDLVVAHNHFFAENQAKELEKGELSLKAYDILFKQAESYNF